MTSTTRPNPTLSLSRRPRIRPLRRPAVTLCSLACLSAMLAGAGCPQDTNSVALNGMDGDAIYYRYFPKNDGFVTLPSSLWRFDPATSESRRITEAKPLYNVQSDGDYYVYEEQEKQAPNGNVVAVRISTGKHITVHTAGSPLPDGYAGTDFLLNAGRVVIFEDSDIVLFDLNAEAVVKTLPITGISHFDADFEGDLLVRVQTPTDAQDLPLTILLVDLNTGQSTQLTPPAADAEYSFCSSPRVSGDWLAVLQYRGTTNTLEAVNLFAYHLPTQTWSQVAQWDLLQEASPLFEIPEMFYIGDLEGKTAIVSSYASHQFWNAHAGIDVIDLETTQQTSIASATGPAALYGPALPRLHSNRAYWIDDFTDVLHVYDIATNQESLTPLTTGQD